MAPEITELLVAAFRLVDAGDTPPADTIRIQDKEFRVFAEQHKKHGMVVLLMQQPDRMPRDYRLQTEFGFSDRQVEVARLLMKRYSNREIGDALGMTASTAVHHVGGVMRKMGVSSRNEVRMKLRGLYAL